MTTTTTERNTINPTGTRTLADYVYDMNYVPVPTDTYIARRSMLVTRDGVEAAWPAGTIVYKPDEWGGDAALHKDFMSERPALRSHLTNTDNLYPLTRCQPQDLRAGDLAVARWEFDGQVHNYVIVISEDYGGVPSFRGWTMDGGQFDFDEPPSGMSFSPGTEGELWRIPLRTHTFPCSDLQPGDEAVVVVPRPQGSALSVGDHVWVREVMSNSVDLAPYFTVQTAEMRENDSGTWAVYPSSLERVAPITSNEVPQSEPSYLSQLEAQVQALRAERTDLLRQWEQQNTRMGNVFMEAAADNDLCSVYDQTVDSVNTFLRFPLPERSSSYHVCTTVEGETTITFSGPGIEVEAEVGWSGTYCASVEARSADDISTDDVDVDLSEIESIEITDTDTGYIYDNAELVEAIYDAWSTSDINDITIDNIDSE